MNDTKQRILDVAAQLFAERGYELVGINELIEKSGVAKATFYQHFRSKEKLCAEWLRSEATKADSLARTLLEQNIPAVEKIASKFDHLRQFLPASEYRGCSFSNTATVMIEDNSVCEVVRDYKSSCRLFWQALALEIKHDPSAARALGDTLFLLYSGAVTEAQNAHAIWPVESAKVAALALCQ